MFEVFRKTYTVTRVAAGDYVDGKWVEGATSTFTIQASLQPAKPKEMEMLPEGRRNQETYKLYSDTQLRTVEEDETNPE